MVKSAAHVEYPILVIDEEGHVLSEGRAALRRLASRAGRWRLLASSPAMIVLGRDEGQGTVVAAESAPKVALSGEIDAHGGLFDLVGFLHQSQWSGALHALEGGTHRTIWFKRGDIRTSGSNLPSDRLGELLYRFGHVTREDLDRALQRVGPNQRIGQALVELGVVSSHDIFMFIRKQVEEVFFAVLRLRRGVFYFERS